MTPTFFRPQKQFMFAKEHTSVGYSKTFLFGAPMSTRVLWNQQVYLESDMPEFESELPPAIYHPFKFPCLYKARDISNYFPGFSEW